MIALLLENDTLSTSHAISLSPSSPYEAWTTSVLYIRLIHRCAGVRTCYSHGLFNPEIEARALEIAPASSCAHDYRRRVLAWLWRSHFPLLCRARDASVRDVW